MLLKAAAAEKVKYWEVAAAVSSLAGCAVRPA